MSSRTQRTGAGTPGSSVKEQRAASREAKLEKLRREQARSKRNKRIGILAGVTAAVLLIGLVVASVILAPRPATYAAGSAGVEIAGVETFENTGVHVETPVDYPQTPPAGGDHSGAWLNCGVYTEPVPNENATHSMEHGAIWVTYDPAELSEEELSTLRSLLPSTYAVLSPYDGMDSPLALSAWNAQLKLDTVDRERVSAFFEEYWQGQGTPEPGAPCTGGIDGPGKVR